VHEKTPDFFRTLGQAKAQAQTKTAAEILRPFQHIQAAPRLMFLD
jgi:hypothetical protein